MTQLDFDLTPPTESHPRTNVRETSIAQYADGRERFKGRKGTVLRWLAAYWNRHGAAPTSGELAAEHCNDMSWKSWDYVLLYTRRGLSDLQTSGVIESVPNGQRPCNVMSSRQETWRVIPSGRS